MSTVREITNYLIRGGEPEEKIMLLISLTSIRSEKVIKVLKAYYCRGMGERDIQTFYGVTQSNLNRDRHKIERAAGIVEALYEFKSKK